MVTADTAAPGALAVPTPGMDDPAATSTGGGGSMRAQMAQMAAAAQATYQGGKEHVASAPPAPIAPTAAASSATPTKGGRTKVSDYSMPLPRLPAPETSHYSGMSYETSASAAPTPVSPTFAATGAVPRSRDVGAGEPNLVPAATPKRGTTVHVTIPTSGPTTPATVVPNIRAPPAGAHRRSHSMSQRPTMLPKWGGLFGHGEKGVDEEGDQGVLREPRTAGPETTSFEEKQGQEYHTGEHGHLHGHGHSPLASGATLVRKFGSLLSGGSVKGASRSGGISPRTSDVGDESIPPGTPIIAAPPPAAAAAGSLKKEERMTASASTPISGTPTSTPPSVHRRAQTILDPAGRNGRHERRSSTGGAALMGLASSFSSGGTIGRHRRPSTGHGNGAAPTSAAGKPLGGLFGRGEKQVVEEEKEKDDEDREGDRQGHGHEHRRSHEHEHEHDEPETEGEGTDKEFKPVFLKGLFRCVVFLATKILSLNDVLALQQPLRKLPLLSSLISAACWIGCRCNIGRPKPASNAFTFLPSI